VATQRGKCYKVGQLLVNQQSLALILFGCNLKGSFGLVVCISRRAVFTSKVQRVHIAAGRHIQAGDATDQ